EPIVFDGARHVSLATIGDMADRTITINGLSKTYSATGWRIGWAIAPKTLANAMRRTHDFLTVGAPHPLQIAAVAALGLPQSYYTELARSYQAKRDVFVQGLRDAGLDCRPPGGAYYVMADFERFPFEDDWAFAMYLVERLRVAVVPASSFYGDPVDGRRCRRSGGAVAARGASSSEEPSSSPASSTPTRMWPTPRVNADGLGSMGRAIWRSPWPDSGRQPPQPRMADGSSGSTGMRRNGRSVDSSHETTSTGSRRNTQWSRAESTATSVR